MGRGRVKHKVARVRRLWVVGWLENGVGIGWLGAVFWRDWVCGKVAFEKSLGFYPYGVLWLS